MLDWGTIIGGGLTLLGAGGGLGVAAKAFLDKRKQDGDQRLAESDQPVEQYAEIVKELRAEIVRMGNVIDTMRRDYEKSIAESRKEHADCLLKFGRLEGRFEEMTRRVNQVEATGAAQIKQTLTETAVMGNRIIKAAAETAATVAKAAPDSGILKSGQVDREHPLPVEIVKSSEG